ncbi:hypothetical protein [Clostridium cellulovorans]|nr:hypothetical protein [Clostridium cellulovorans]
MKFEESVTIDFFKNQATNKNINISFGYVEKSDSTALNKFIGINTQG